jgi:hypothetical protein
MMRSAILLIILFWAALLLGACGGRASQQPGNTDVWIDLDADSLAVGQTTLTVRVTDGNGAALEDATVNVRGDMNHAGMVPVLAEAVTGGQNGVYRVPFEWTMGGDWIVTVEAILADGESVSQQFNVSVGSGGGGMDMEEAP